MKTVAIVGGGVSGLALIKALKEKLPRFTIGSERVHLVLVNRGQAIGKGMAYSTSIDEHILNMPASTMGFSRTEKDDFLKWCRRNDLIKDELDSQYPSRKLYGRYLSEVSREILSDDGHDKFKISIYIDEVMAIVPTGDRFTLHFQEHSPLLADYSVLTVGSQSSSKYIEWSKHDNYFETPWPSDRLGRIPADQDVAILGAGLTAIDVVRTLSRQGHAGKIRLFSRTGLLPRVQSISTERLEFSIEQRLIGLIHEAKPALTWKHVLREILRTLDDEAGKVDWKIRRNPSESPEKILRADIENAMGPIRWQQILSQTSECIDLVWDALPVKERIKMDKQLMSVWVANRHSMPMFNAQFLLACLEQRQLEVWKLRKWFGDDSWKGLDFQSFLSRTQSQWVINATNYACRLELGKSHLLDQLIHEEVIHSHPNGGIDVDFRSFEVLDVAGLRTKNLFALGALTRGVHLYTNAVERNIEYAYRVAESILVDLSVNPKPIRKTQTAPRRAELFVKS